MGKNVLNISKLLHEEGKKAGVRIGKEVPGVFYDRFSIFVEKYFNDLADITRRKGKKTVDEEDVIHFFSIHREI